MADADDIRQLLTDAKTVARYGAMTGKISGNDLLEAISDVERKPSLSWKDAALTRLVHALGDAAKRIAPLTVLDLRTWDAKSRRRGFFSFYTWVILLAVCLMGATWYFTNQYNKASIISSQLEQLKAEKASLVYSQTILSILRLNSDGGDQPLNREQYFEDVEQLKDIYNRSETFSAAAREYSASEVGVRVSNLLAQAMYYLFPPSQAATPDLTQLPALQEVQASSSGTSTTPPITKVADNATSDTTPNAPPEQQRNLQQLGPCDELQPAQSAFTKAKVTITPAVKASMDFTADANQILCVNKIGLVSNYLNELDRMIADFEVSTGLLALWMLPALYGALGAMVYYMRRIIDPNIPDPPLPRLLYRVALGSFAGIMLGWFWKPDGDIASGFGSLGINVFGWAFLVGFSVEVFFSLLDRIVSELTSWARDGKSSNDNGSTTLPRASN